MTQALILIDIQNDYFPGGALPLQAPEAAAEQAARLLAVFREQELPIVHIQQASTPERGFLVADTKGNEIHDSVAPLASETVMIKHFPNSFTQTDLDSFLRNKGVESVVLAGMMTHMCVSATARSGMEHGYQVRIATDACATRALEFEGEVIEADVVHKTALAEVAGLTQLVNTALLLEELN